MVVQYSAQYKGWFIRDNTLLVDACLVEACYAEACSGWCAPINTTNMCTICAWSQDDYTGTLKCGQNQFEITGTQKQFGYRHASLLVTVLSPTRIWNYIKACPLHCKIKWNSACVYTDYEEMRDHVTLHFESSSTINPPINLHKQSGQATVLFTWESVLEIIEGIQSLLSKSTQSLPNRPHG